MLFTEIILERVFTMQVLEYVLLVLLLLSAAFIIVAVLLQKSSEDGLSGAISGGADTFYGKDKSSHTDRALYKWTIIAAALFMVCVLAVFILQPDFASSYELDAWKTDSNLTNYTHIFEK